MPGRIIGRIPSLAVVLLALLAAAPSAFAQATVAEPRVAAVVTDGALIRAGAADTYYPFGRLPAQSLLWVVGEKAPWIRVQTVGPAFAELYGYVIRGGDEPAALRFLDDGAEARTLRSVLVLAPNLNNDGRVADSWKALVRLDANAPLTVLESFEYERDVVHKVRLPESASGWMLAADVREATGAERRQWEAARRGLAAVDENDGAAAPVLGRPEASAPAPAVELPATTAAPTANEPKTVPAPSGAPTEEPTVAANRPIETPPVAAPSRGRPAAVADDVAPPPAAPEDLELVLEDLESAYERLRREPIETAEVLPLRELYLDLAERSAHKPTIARYANARAEQMEIWSQLQQRRRDIEALRGRIETTSSDTQALVVRVDRERRYAAMGRLVASSIYDGRRLPLLLRVQEPATGRTLAYVRADAHDDLMPCVGRIVGIVGTKDYDGGLRVNLVEPERVEVLEPQPQS